MLHATTATVGPGQMEKRGSMLNYYWLTTGISAWTHHALTSGNSENILQMHLYLKLDLLKQIVCRIERLCNNLSIFLIV